MAEAAVCRSGSGNEPNKVQSVRRGPLALFLLDRGRYEEAIAEYERAIDIDPENVQGFIGLGESLRQSGDPDGAEEWYRKALMLAPGHPIASLYVSDR